jgi:hypothetical protein
MTLSSRDRTLLIVIVIVAVAFGFDKFALSPQRHRAAALDRQIAAQQSALSQAQESFASGRSAAAAVRADATTWAAAQRAVPQNSDIPGLLRLLQRSARRAHVDIQSVSLTGTTSGTSPLTTPGSTSTGPTEIPVALTFEGGYQSLNRLVGELDGLVVASGTRLRADGPLVGIDNVSLSPAGKGGNVSVQLTATIYQRAAAATATGTDPATEGAS